MVRMNSVAKRSCLLYSEDNMTSSTPERSTPRPSRCVNILLQTCASWAPACNASLCSFARKYGCVAMLCFSSKRPAFCRLLTYPPSSVLRHAARLKTASFELYPISTLLICNLRRACALIVVSDMVVARSNSICAVSQEF